MYCTDWETGRFGLHSQAVSQLVPGKCLRIFPFFCSKEVAENCEIGLVKLVDFRIPGNPGTELPQWEKNSAEKNNKKSNNTEDSRSEVDGEEEFLWECKVLKFPVELWWKMANLMIYKVVKCRLKAISEQKMVCEEPKRG